MEYKGKIVTSVERVDDSSFLATTADGVFNLFFSDYNVQTFEELVSTYGLSITKNLPNWTQLKHELLETTIFQKALKYGNGNAYATILKVITDGETTWASENLFRSMFLALGITLTEGETALFNQILERNQFTIRFE